MQLATTASSMDNWECENDVNLPSVRERLRLTTEEIVASADSSSVCMMYGYMQNRKNGEQNDVYKVCVIQE
eukprot:scaffold69689_cov48-Prasinocladus_malaysianus.AAC.2